MANNLLEKRREQMFPKLTPSQLARLEAHSVRRETRAAEILVEVGDQPQGLYIVLTGTIEILAPFSDVRTQTSDYVLLNVLTAGDFGGEMSTLRGTRSLARLRVGEPGEVLQMGLDEFRRVVQNDSELSELMMRAFILRRMGMLQSGSSEVTVLGSSRAGDTLRIREFLTRNARPYIDIDIDRDPDAQALLERFHVRPQDLPVVVCRAGEVFKNPANGPLAECLGINGQPDDTGVHDLIIIGAGPAGLAAAVYAASEGLDVRIVDSFAPGGQAGTSSRIENYLGFPTGISGGALAGRALSQAQKFGAQLSVAWQAVRLRCDEWPYAVDMSDGRRLRGRAIVIASGAQYRTLRSPMCSAFSAAASTTPRRTSKRGCATARTSSLSGAAIRPDRPPCFSPARAATYTCSCGRRASPKACPPIWSAASRTPATSRCTPARRSPHSTARIDSSGLNGPRPAAHRCRRSCATCS